MSFLPDIFTDSSGKKEKKSDRRQQRSDLPSGEKSYDTELMEVMKAKNLDMTSSSITLTTSKTSSHISVTRSNMLRSIEQGIEKVRRNERKLFSNLSDSEEEKLEMEVHAAEDNSGKIVNSDIDQREKLIVSSAVLLEASEIIADHIDDLYGFKAELGDRGDANIRGDMRDLWNEINKIVEMNMPAYSYIHENARDEPELIPVTVKSANLFRNTVKVFSALTLDSGQAIQRKQKYQNKEHDFISSNQTIFQQYFDN